MKLPVFFSYSNADDAYRQDLEKHLKILERHGLIDGWSDREIAPGSNWEEEINFNLTKAKIILLLVSADFLESDYCYETETVFALEQHEKGLATVVPVLLRPCFWEIAHFKALPVLPSNSRAVSEWENKDAAWKNIVEGLNLIIEKIHQDEKNKPGETDRDALDKLNFEIAKMHREMHHEFRDDESLKGVHNIIIKDEILPLQERRAILIGEHEKVEIELRQASSRLASLYQKMEEEKNSLWAWLFGWEVAAAPYNKAKEEKSRLENRKYTISRELEDVEQEIAVRSAKHRQMWEEHNAYKSKRIFLIREWEQRMAMAERKKQDLLTGIEYPESTLYLPNWRELVEKFFTYTNSEDMRPMELRLSTLLFHFLMQFHSWYFTPRRISGFGSLQPGFEELQNYSLQQMENCLDDMKRGGVVRSLKTKHGNRLYRIMG